MNKKASFGSLLLGIIFIILVVTLLYLGWRVQQSIIDHGKILAFCNEKPYFCYCSTIPGNCEFRIEEDLFSKEIQELCELATELNDKEIMFEARCGG